MNFLLGAVDVARISENVGSSTTTGHGSARAAPATAFAAASERHHPHLFRHLSQNDALALLSIGGNAYDDVLTMPPLFVQN